MAKVSKPVKVVIQQGKADLYVILLL